jgi:uncharacterized protein DUF2851
MKEDFLSWIWKYREFNSNQILTTDDVPVNIINPGQLNTDSGPDFFNARVKIGDTVWAGNVEIHSKASDWYRHNHNSDPAYDNVVLHVVYQNDRAVCDNSGRVLPAVELKNYIPESAISNYKLLSSELSVIACKQQLKQIDPISMFNWTDRMLASRLELKMDRIKVLQKRDQNLTIEILYHLLARNFGFNTNGDPFSMLAFSLPYSTILKHANSPFQIEALLFGQSGLLYKKFESEYPQQLSDEYRHLARKYKLEPLQKKVWKFMRLRPANFPTIKISQFASLLTKLHKLNDAVIYTDDFNMLKKLLNVHASPYWNNRYSFDVESGIRDKNLGKDSVFNIIINSICPYLFWMGKSCGDEQLMEKALKYARLCPPENNRITRLWKNTPVVANNGGDTQALYHLVTNFCYQKKCLNCAWGSEIILKK